VQGRNFSHSGAGCHALTWQGKSLSFNGFPSVEYPPDRFFAEDSWLSGSCLLAAPSGKTLLDEARNGTAILINRFQPRQRTIGIRSRNVFLSSARAVFPSTVEVVWIHSQYVQSVFESQTVRITGSQNCSSAGCGAFPWGTNACSVSVSVIFNSVCGLSLDKERQGSRYALLENANEQIFAVILSQVFHDPTTLLNASRSRMRDRSSIR
jgi:hypothetical protein